MSILNGGVKPGLGGLIGLLLSGCATIADGPEEIAGTPLQKSTAIHQAAIVIDAHADIALPETSPLYLGADGVSKVAPDKISEGNFDVVIMSLAAGPQPRTENGRADAYAEAMDKLETMQNTVAANSETLSFATTSAEVRTNSDAGLTSIILSLQNVQSLENDLSRLDLFYEAGVRVYGLNHIGHNDFSDSSRPTFNGETGAYEVTEEHGGLSQLGREAVERIDALGGIIDVSQMSKAATLQAIELSNTPVIASHSNVKALSNVTRNLSDEEIDSIGATGGVIHIAAFSAYLVDLSDPVLLEKIRTVRVDAGLPEAYSYPFELYWELDTQAEKLTFLGNMRDLVGREDVARMVDHIDYVVERIGIEHVGIGTDFNHGGGIVGFEEADSAINVTEELLSRGYTPTQINQIWGENFLRVLDQASN